MGDWRVILGCVGMEKGFEIRVFLKSMGKRE